MRGYIVLIVGVLVIVSVAWVGVSLYDSVSGVDTSPDVERFLRPIQAEFDLETLEEVDGRVEGLPVSPEVFLELERAVQESDGGLPDLSDVGNSTVISIPQEQPEENDSQDSGGTDTENGAGTEEGGLF